MKAKIRKAIEEKSAGSSPKPQRVFPGKDARGRWVKGFSGNNLGRPRTALAELCRAQVTKHGLVNVLGSIAAGTGEFSRKTKVPLTVGDRINAIKLLLMYGYGIPKAEIDSGDVRIEVHYDQRSINVTNAASGTGEDHQGVQTVQRPLLRSKVGQNSSGAGSADPSRAQG